MVQTAIGYGVLNQNTMSSDSATDLATQSSIKAYVESLPIGGGAFDFIETQTISGTPSSVVFDNLSATYVAYLLTYSQVSPDNTTQLRLELSSDNGSTWHTTAGDYYINRLVSNGADISASNSGNMAVALGLTDSGTLSSGRISGWVLLCNPTNASYKTMILSSSLNGVNGGNNFNCYSQCIRTTAEADDAFRLTWVSPRVFDEGVFFLYGLKAS